jgi:uncharacterized protein YbaR (Trm112 family)
MSEILDEELFAGAIIYCPVCCTNIDVDDEGEVALVCNNCRTKFTVVIERAIIANHSIVG